MKELLKLRVTKPKKSDAVKAATVAVIAPAVRRR